MESSDADSRHLSDQGVIGTFEASVGSQCPVGQGFLCLWVVVLIMWQLEGLIADKQQDYEEGSSALKGTVRGKPLICQPQRKLVGTDQRRLGGKKGIQDIKAKCEEDIEIGRKGWGVLISKGSVHLSLVGLSVICPDFTHAFSLRPRRVDHCIWAATGQGRVTV